ncbi:MAG: hypothetical protein UY52_C0024G0007 [Parcubacteria group bacterium GW2011_GWC2_49_9]|nr:MAG: hypothetical protein UY52_C0024G0007 [Parcubacteria group bacterium GW2011_GWC2_49_9]
MVSRSVKRMKAGSHVKVKTFYGVLCAALLGFLFVLPAARAQWFEPWVGAAPGGPNTDAPLYGGANSAYSGNAQARLGPLTIGSATLFDDATVLLYVNGKTLVRNELTVGNGPAITIPDSAITGLSATANGIYGVSSNSAGAGVFGETLITGGKALIGDAGAYSNAVGVYGYAIGISSMAIEGSSATGFAGFFEGKVMITGDFAGVQGTVVVDGDSTFRSNLAVANMLNVGSLTIKGIPFEADKVNAPSVQDQESATPADDPGIRMFTLSSADNIAFCPNCTSDGIIGPGTVLAWDVGPLGAKRLIDETNVVIGYSAQYLGGGAGNYATLSDFASATLEYQECDVTGEDAAGLFRLTNDTGVDARFRLQVWYKEIPTLETCIPPQPWRQVTVSDAVDLGDTVRISATGADASAIFNKTTIDQIRLFYVPTSTEIDVDITQFTAANIDIWFKAQGTTAGADSMNYKLYYGVGGNWVNPALRDRNYVYLLWDDFDDNSLNAAKWTTYAVDAFSSVTEDTQILNIRHNNPGGNQWTGSSAYTTSSYPKNGRYTVSFLFNPEMSDNGIGNDGFFIRNTAVNRDTANYGGAAEKGIYFGLANPCGVANGITVRTRGAAAAGFTCGFGANTIGTFPGAGYAEGTWYPFEIEFNADTGGVNIQQPIGTSRVSGTANAADYATIVGNFVLEMHDAAFYGVVTSGNERYNDFTFRRGKNSFDPPATLGPEN